MKKILVVLLMSFVLVGGFVLVGCNQNFVDIYDNDSKIAGSNSAYSNKSIFNTTSKEFTVSAGMFTGVRKIKSINLDANPKIDLSIDLSEGRFKVVAVNQDKIVYIIQEGNANGVIETTLQAGNYDLKIVGQNAKIKARVSLEFTY